MASLSKVASKKINHILTTLALALCLCACGEEDRINTPTPAVNLRPDSVFINGAHVASGAAIGNLPLAPVSVRIKFNAAVNVDSMNKSYIYFSGRAEQNYTYAGDSKDATVLHITTEAALASSFERWQLHISEGRYLGGKVKMSYECTLIADAKAEPVFPQISNDSLLTLVQHQTFKYFWDYAHPASGLARERSNSGNTVTAGGSGFGFMAILIGIKRGFITRQEGLERFTKIVDFLSASTTEKFHGAFPHWMNGQTGKAIAFSANDNGGDLVETAFLMQGLLAVNEYFKNGTSTEEIALCAGIQTLWKNVEWDWYRQGGQNVLYWHWSPDKGWAMNMKIQGWNECLIAYVLAAASPTHSVPKEVYDQGWARNGNMRNGNEYHGVTLPLGGAYGGPMFFAHYSFLGLNPAKISDRYADYWGQNVAHARINHSYCAANPKGYVGYSAECWGLTASDIPNGYAAGSPTNDRGTIAPTASLSSFPYTPEESLAALRFFYYKIGDKLWKEYGFKDAFSLTQGWYASDFLAIDQGPIVVMIENYRTGFVWDLFMQNADVQSGLTKLGFTIK
ncbi:MAG: beta-glucosidase [Prevotellaceae bacterium]|jgi:hypothetical protein|nr:beta-glucosidase [Prevotellaceae bacterium]